MHPHKTPSTTPSLRVLHWLPMVGRIRFKVLVEAFKAVHGIASSYASALMQVRVPGCTLRSSTRLPRYTSFFKVAPHLWNELPVSLRTLHVFKRHLKTVLFFNYDS